MADRKVTTALWCHSGPFWGKAFYGLAYPKIEKFVRRAYCGNAETVTAAAQSLEEALKVTDEILTTSTHLVDGSLSRADIAVASLLAPLVGPQPFPVQWPVWTRTMGELQARGASRPTLQFAARLYAQERSA